MSSGRDSEVQQRGDGTGQAARREPGTATRDRIIAAAEELFAARGVDAVSLVEIGVAAGQRNRSAVQYHFHDKAGMVAAVRAKHQPAIEAHRIQLLEELESRPAPRLRGFVEALVYPLAEHVRSTPGGRAYLCMSAGLLGHPEYSPMSRESTASPTAVRLMSHLSERSRRLPHDAVGPRMLLVTGMLFHGLADHARGPSAPASGDEDQWRQIVENLVICIVAVLKAPEPGPPQGLKQSSGSGASS